MKLDWRYVGGGLLVALIIGVVIWRITSIPDPSKPTAQVPAGEHPMTTTPPESEASSGTEASKIPTTVAH